MKDPMRDEYTLNATMCVRKYCSCSERLSAWIAIDGKMESTASQFLSSTTSTEAGNANHHRAPTPTVVTSASAA